MKITRRKRQYISYTFFRFLFVINSIIFFGSFGAFECGNISKYQLIFQALFTFILCIITYKLVVIFTPRKVRKYIGNSNATLIYKMEKDRR